LSLEALVLITLRLKEIVGQEVEASGQWLAVLGAAGGSGIAAVQLGRALGPG
jgi:NADPH:quinone reductase-like Zn-dependent oxidoreductase